MSVLQITNSDYNNLRCILSKYPYTFYAYGSRTKGNARKFSDLDLCYQENIPRQVIYQIQEELEESNLPFIVELVNWKHMRTEFREFIRSDLTLI